jgi:hypothetical protein
VARNAVMNDTFFATILRDEDYALVTIYAMPEKYKPDYTTKIECWETLSRGASRSARRAINNLEKAAFAKAKAEVCGGK